MTSNASISVPSYRDSAASFLPARTFAGFAIALLAVVTLAVLSYQALMERSETAARVTRANEVLERLDRVMSHLKDMETGQRGFLMTGVETFLEPYVAASSGLPPQLDGLREKLRDDPVQSERLATLEQVIGDNDKVLAEGIRERREGVLSVAAMLDQADRGKLGMDRIRLQGDAMIQAERSSLATHQAQWQRAASVTFYVQLGGTGALLFLIGAAAILASRDHREREIQAWLRTGQMGLAHRMQGDLRLETLGENLLEFLARFLDAQRGTVYLLEGEKLHRVAAYAASGAPLIAELDDGLLGQTARADRALHVRQVPGDYFPVASALGRRDATELLIAPARADGAVVAVIELGFFRSLQARDLEFLERVADMLGTSVRSSRDRSRLEVLLEETQRQSEELQTQQEELRVTNEELEEQGRMLRQSQTMLEAQQTELEQSNAQLEEQTQQLEVQRDELTQAQTALETRATDLQRANQYKTEFLANMSHELRTPLNSTLILAKLLADNAHGNLSAEQVRFAQTIGSAGNDLLVLINDILDLSKIEAGKVEVASEPIDLAIVLDSMNTTFEPIARNKGLTFSLHMDPNAPRRMYSDRQRLGQILKNLLSNAIKFTERGHVSIEARAVGTDRLQIAVRDTGIGMPTHQHEVIFEAFRQADGSTHRKYGGTGLGLSISRDLARLLGGDISVASKPDEGSVFVLELPIEYSVATAPRLSGERDGTHAVARAPSPPPRPEPQRNTTAEIRATSSGSRSAAAPSLTPAMIDDDRYELRGDRMILAIEDDAAFATLLRDLAREMGFQCVVTQNAADGLSAASAYLPNAILLDVKLPDHSGLGVLDQLKHDARTRHIPVHVVSASDYSREAMELGAVGYAIKPVKREELVKALQRLEAKFSQDVRRVLVVEDDERQRASVAALLSNGNTQIVGVPTAADALAQLGTTTFDCIVMDLTLPDLSGYELLEKMAQRDDVAFPPVIVYTGRSLSRDEEQNLRRFSKSIILKGVRSPERLLDEVTLFLHQVESALPADRQRMLKAARDREAALEGRRVLVVEDDVRNVFALTSLLEPKGAKVEIARNGREALEALQRQSASDAGPVDLILMDIMMPEMDGLTAMREIRRRPEWSRIPIIALTAKAMKDDHDQCLAAGANDYMAKPLDVERLLSLVRVWMPK